MSEDRQLWKNILPHGRLMNTCKYNIRCSTNKRKKVIQNDIDMKQEIQKVKFWKHPTLPKAISLLPILHPTASQILNVNICNPNVKYLFILFISHKYATQPAKCKILIYTFYFPQISKNWIKPKSVKADGKIHRKSE